MDFSRSAIHIIKDVFIPISEINYSFSRSGGKGGQNVNKVETKVELSFNITRSSLPDNLKERLLEKLKPRLTDSDELKLSCQETRHQLKNKELVTQRFRMLLKDALKPQKLRKKTSPTRASKEKRLLKKKKTTLRKSFRQRPEL